MYVFFHISVEGDEQAKASSFFPADILFFVYGYSIAREIHLPAVVTQTSL